MTPVVGILLHTSGWGQLADHNIPDDAEFCIRTDGAGCTEWVKKCGMNHEHKQQILHHRKNGPSLLWDDGSYEWCIRGRRHRIGGPAYHDITTGIMTWYVNGLRVLNLEHYQQLSKCSDEELMILKLEWGDI